MPERAENPLDWDSALYESRHGFVAQYGKALLDFIAPDPRQTILDLGCGTGNLNAELATRAGSVLGVDASASMVERARRHFPQLDFQVRDALELPFENRFDIVFSNAVFHWIPDHECLLGVIHRALKPHGRLVCEFGAAGNVGTIREAFARACAEAGLDCTTRFTFPEAPAFCRLLAKQGFTPDEVISYARPTTLQGGDAGLRTWLRQFFAAELAALPEKRQTALFRRVEALTRDRLWNGNAWVADYQRLRVRAHI